MTGSPLEYEDVRGFFAPVHRALTEQILLGGAPRAVAILNGTLAGAVGAYHETETCSIECRENLLISRIPKRHCDQCGKLYQPVKTHSTYCSDECRTNHKNEKRNAESVASRAPRPCDHCGESYTPSKANQMYCGPRCKANALYARNGWVVMEPKPCVECGSMFTPRKRNTQEYCSSKCQIRVWARRRREKAKAAKQAARSSLFFNESFNF